jgi:hypothetical protein
MEIPDNSFLSEIQRGVILLFYALEPIKGLVGFATVTNKIELNNSYKKFEFERNYCLPSFLWEQQKINLNTFHKNKGIYCLNNNEEIAKISNIIKLKWGTELKNNIESDILEKPLFNKNKCIECDKEVEGRKTKYCTECRTKVRRRQSIEWNKRNIDKIKEAGRKWRKNNPEKVKKYSRRWKATNPNKVKEQKKKWREKKKKIDPSLQKKMSDWCRKLRSDSTHLFWMNKQKKRRDRIAEIEDKFSCCWEDKFKKMFENHTHEYAAEILDLNYHTLLIWAKHLKLQRKCIYCGKKLAGKNNFHSECNPKNKRKDVSVQRKSGVKELFAKITPSINAEILSDNSIIQALKDISSPLTQQETLIIENRYFKKRKTLKELGTQLGLTRERIRQIEIRAINKLSHPFRVKLLQKKIREAIFRRETDLKSPLSKKITELQKELDELKKKVNIKKPLEEIDKPLSEIELSFRVVNCLSKTNIKTLRELANRTEAQMLNIRSLGKKTLFDLREILNSFGLDFKNRSISSNIRMSNEKKSKKYY